MVPRAARAAGAAYNIPFALRLSGALDLAGLDRALDQLGRRHEILRTSFVSVEGVPQARIAAEPALRLRRLDWRDRDPGDGALAELLEQEAHRPFDLAAAPLLRVTLVQLPTPDEAVLLATMHHAITDAWSIDILLRELAELYQRGDASTLAPLPLQYVDFAAWQRERLSGARLDQQLAHWLEQLRGCPRATRAADRSPAAAGADGARRHGDAGPARRAGVPAARARAAGGGDAVHGPPRRVRRAFAPLHRSATTWSVGTVSSRVAATPSSRA